MKEKKSGVKTNFWKNPKIMKCGILGILYGITGPIIFVVAGHGWPNMMWVLITIPFIPSAITGFTASSLMEWYTCKGGVCRGGTINYILNSIPNVILWFVLGCLLGHIINIRTKRRNDEK
jgi:hypothetical protein